MNTTDETDVLPYPDISYYADGTVITPGSVGELVTRRLTTAGLEAVLDRVRASGLFTRDRRFAALLPNRGVAAVTVDLADPAGATVRVQAFVNADTTGDASRFLDLAAALVEPAAWLPSDAWAQVPQRYVPVLIRVQTTIEQVKDPAPRPADITDVAWPLAVPFDGIGDLVSDDPTYLMRCGVLPAADALAVRMALLAAGAVPDGDWTGTIPLRYGADRAISYAFTELLPDGVPSCARPPEDAWWSIESQVAYARAGAAPVVRLYNAADGSDVAIARGADLAWSPDGSRLAVLRPRTDGLPDLWIVDVDAGTSKRIVRGVVHVGWSPKGDLLAISRSPVDVGDLWLVRPDGGGLRELTQGGGQFAWSPDGTRLAVVTGTASPVLGVLDVATGKRIDLVPGTDPAWTGEVWPRIAYVAWGTDRLAVVDPVTGVIAAVKGPDADVAGLVRVEAATPSGWALTFLADGAGWVLDDPAGAAIRLTAPGEVISELSALPGGKWLVAVVRNATGIDVVALLADGDGWFQLTEVGDVLEAAARPKR